MYLLGLKKAGEKKRWSTEKADPTRQANQNKKKWQMSANNNSCLTENNNQALLTRLTSSTARCIIRGKAKGQECFPSTHVVPQKTQIKPSYVQREINVPGKEKFMDIRRSKMKSWEICTPLAQCVKPGTST